MSTGRVWESSRFSCCVFVCLEHLCLCLCDCVCACVCAGASFSFIHKSQPALEKTKGRMLHFGAAENGGIVVRRCATSTTQFSHFSFFFLFFFALFKKRDTWHTHNVGKTSARSFPHGQKDKNKKIIVLAVSRKHVAQVSLPVCLSWQHACGTEGGRVTAPGQKDEGVPLKTLGRVTSVCSLIPDSDWCGSNCCYCFWFTNRLVSQDETLQIFLVVIVIMISKVLNHNYLRCEVILALNAALPTSTKASRTS